MKSILLSSHIENRIKNKKTNKTNNTNRYSFAGFKRWLDDCTQSINRTNASRGCPRRFKWTAFEWMNILHSLLYSTSYLYRFYGCNHYVSWSIASKRLFSSHSHAAENHSLWQPNEKLKKINSWKKKMRREHRKAIVMPFSTILYIFLIFRVFFCSIFLVIYIYSIYI